MTVFVLGFAGLAAAFASHAKSMESYQSIIMVMNLPVLFLSNSLYPLEKMPPTLRGLALLNPITYAVDACRVLLYNTRAEIDLGLDLAVLVVFMSDGLAMGFHFFQKAMQRTGVGS
ncbi:MAG: ABC transporter permease [Chloroflexi bacterium]|nr:ABC transporter permease [Chloroflexota bacterium]